MSDASVATPQLLKVGEAAALARVSRRHIYRLIEAGQIPAIRVGNETGPLRVPGDDFRRWLWGDEGGTAA